MSSASIDVIQSSVLSVQELKICIFKINITCKLYKMINARKLLLMMNSSWCTWSNIGNCKNISKFGWRNETFSQSWSTLIVISIQLSPRLSDSSTWSMQSRGCSCIDGDGKKGWESSYFKFHYLASLDRKNTKWLKTNCGFYFIATYSLNCV